MDPNIASQHPPGSFRSGKNTIQFNLAGLVILCTSLVAVTTVVTRQFAPSAAPAGKPTTASTKSTALTAPPAKSVQPWGDLRILDISIEQPEEYVAFESTTPPPAAWVFGGTTRVQVRELMAESGFSANQLDQAMAAERVEETASATIVRPDSELIFSLTPEVRSKFYTVLARWTENEHMTTPYHLPGATFGDVLANTEVSPENRDLVQKLSYTRNGRRFFSDVEVVMQQIETPKDRLHLLKALTYQTAVVAGLQLDSTSDIEQILGYWAGVPGVRAKDLRPLLESIAKTPTGGAISLLHLLPPFARERLYTFPLPTVPGDVRMDCHWTALNFFNEEQDDRLQDNAYASAQIKEHFYQIGKPSKCGDLVFLTNQQGEVIHSAVYLADDICFTKNGINYGQPWILMRMKALSDVYTFAEQPQALFYRRKEA
jgi:hypothetical protein